MPLDSTITDTQAPANVPLALPHLHPVPKEKDLYRYRDRPEGEVIEIDVDYSADSSRRGIYLSIRPATVSESSYVVLLSTMIRQRVVPLKRANPRLLQEVVRLVEPRTQELAAAFRADREAGTAAFRSFVTELAASLAAS